MFVDLTVAHNIVLPHIPICKLLNLLSDRHMVKMVMELVTNPSFTFTGRQAGRQEGRQAVRQVGKQAGRKAGRK